MFNHLMPNQRKKGKKLVGFFATEEEAGAMMAAAKAQGMTLADWLRSLIPEGGVNHLREEPPPLPASGKTRYPRPTSKKRGAKSE